MSKVTIYGASDDLIEVDGAIDEEFYASDERGNYLAFSDGTVLSVTYAAEGIWRIARLFAGSAAYEKQEATDADSQNYSDLVTLEGDLTWVLYGSEIGRADRGTNTKAAGA